MISFPKAKINLGLRIIEKRPDGFHNIETIFYPIALSDALEFVVLHGNGKNDQLINTGIKVKTSPDKNLVIKAVNKIRAVHKVPALKIHLHKAIPAGAGLGGGSSDAACMIKSINKCFRFNMSGEEMKMIALEAGSDCPFFLDPVPSYGTGRGELLTHVDPVLRGYHIVLLNPGIMISTKEAYHNCRPTRHETNLADLIKIPVKSWKELFINDFEDFVFKVYPIVGELKKALYKSGAVFSSMTGSGSTVFGIFEDKPKITGKMKNYLIYEGVL